MCVGKLVKCDYFLPQRENGVEMGVLYIYRVSIFSELLVQRSADNVGCLFFSFSFLCVFVFCLFRCGDKSTKLKILAYSIILFNVYKIIMGEFDTKIIHSLFCASVVFFETIM